MKISLAVAIVVMTWGAADNRAAEPNVAPGDAAARKEKVQAVFQAYILSERSVRLLPGQMEFNWSDIPALLELGKSERVLDTKDRTFGRMYLTAVPTKPVPSQGQSQAIEGMVSLWLVEGIRCGQGASFRPPLYAFCTRGAVSQEVCEVSAGMHRETLAAYRRWWEKVKDLPAKEAAAQDPLAGTGLQWCGPQPVMETPAEAPPKPEPAVKAAAPIEGLPDPPFTIDEVAAYHREQTGSDLAPEMLKRLYTSIAINDFSHGGDRSGLLDAARRALAFEQDEATRLQLYSRLADGYYFRKETPVAQQRKSAAVVLLVGLREVLSHELPDVAPEQPTMTVFHINGQGTEADAAIRKADESHKAQMAVHEKIKRIEILIGFRKEFTQRLVSEYGYRERTTQSLDELHDLAFQYLGDETAAQQLRAAAEAYQNPSSPVPVLRLVKP